MVERTYRDNQGVIFGLIMKNLQEMVPKDLCDLKERWASRQEPNMRHRFRTDVRARPR
jgi:hypothetical protein